MGKIKRSEMLGSIENSKVVQRCKYKVSLLFKSLFHCLYLFLPICLKGGRKICVGEICVYSQSLREISNLTTLLTFCKKFRRFERFVIHLQPVLSNKMFHNLFIKSRLSFWEGCWQWDFDYIYCKIAFRIPTFEEVLLKILSHQNCCYLHIFSRITLI